MTARAWALFAGVSVLWGVPYLFIKVAVDELSPALVAWSRCAIAAAVLLPLAARAGALRGSPAVAADRLRYGLPTAAPSGEVTLSVLVLGLLCSALAPSCCSSG